MKSLAVCALLLAACDSPAPPAEPVREPIAVEYVRAAELPIHTRPAGDAPVVTTYRSGESVSVLSKRGDWVEVRTAAGSGWAHAADLADAAEASKSEADNSTPRFIHTPDPVTEPGAHGEMVLEASVNGDGEVTAVRVLHNTTGSRSLEMKNIGALEHARFTPVVKHGRRMPFTYEHRIHY